MRCNTDLETWLHDFEDDIFRILVYRKPGQYTPYEMENKFSDESLYVDNEYKRVFIEDVIELPDKDVYDWIQRSSRCESKRRWRI